MPADQQQQPVNIPVGFYINQTTYDQYQAIADHLHSQKGVDANGREINMIDKPDVNHFIAFSVNFFIQNLQVFDKFQSTPGADKMMKAVMKMFKGKI